MPARERLSVLALGSLLACGRSPTTPPAPAPAGPVTASPEADAGPARPPLPPPTLNARVFTDVSGSMNGFIQRGKTTIASVQTAIEEALSAVGRAGPRRCMVGETLECSPVPPATGVYDQARTYNALRSRLDEVLRRKPVPDRIDPDHPPAPDLVDEAHVTVLVTDGMQVSGSGSLPSATTDTSASDTLCQGGADPNCITALLRERTREGYGVWLVHTLLPFKGTHYTERPLDDSYRLRTVAHLNDITTDPRWNGVEFSVGPRVERDRGGNGEFQFQGFKPLLLIVIARDPAVGRAFTAAVTQRLKSQPIQPGRVSPDNATQSVELAPLAPARYRLTTFAPAPSADQAGITAEAQHEVRLRGATPGPDGLTTDVWCGANGKQLFYAGWAMEPGPVPLPGYVRQTLALAGPRQGLPAGAAAPAAERADQHAFRVGINCTALPPGASLAEYELRGTLQFDDAASATEWWATLSSDNTWEAPERMYGLRQMAEGVLRAQATGRQRFAGLKLQITRE